MNNRILLLKKMSCLHLRKFFCNKKEKELEQLKKQLEEQRNL